MAKKKKEVIDEEIHTDSPEDNPISPIEVTFGSGDLNLLKEKINELIARIN